MTSLQDLLNNQDKEYKSFEDWFYGNGKFNRGMRMERFWECYVEGTNGGRHYQHRSLESAEKEAERLATLPSNQGLTVYLFQCVGKCKAEPVSVKWEVPR